MADKHSQPLSLPALSGTPANADSGYMKIYAKSDGKLYGLDSAGVEYNLTVGYVSVTKTLTTGAWTLVSGLYEQSLSDSAITAASVVDVIPDNANAAIVKTAEFMARTDSSAGSVKVYCTNLPSANIGVTLNIFK